MNISSMSFKELISTVIIKGIIQPITVLIFALSILYFLWNVFQFIRNIDNKDEIEKFKKNTLWGIVAIFVMASMWGLVQILVNSFVPGAGIPVFNSGSSSFNPRPANEGSEDFFQFRPKNPSFNFNDINAEENPYPYDLLNNQPPPSPKPNYGLTGIPTLKYMQGE